MKIDINKVLVYVLCALAGIIVFCTVTAFMAGKANFGNTYRKGDPADISQIRGADTKEELREFKELGTLRALTKPEEEVSTGVNLVVTPWFSYTNADSAFYEELSHKKKSIKTIFLNYFSNHTQKELFSLGEKNVKEELLSLVNSNLVMGKIKAIYFDDYIFLD